MWLEVSVVTDMCEDMRIPFVASLVLKDAINRVEYFQTKCHEDVQSILLRRSGRSSQAGSAFLRLEDLPLNFCLSNMF